MSFLPPAERAGRHAEKRRAVLRFLRTNVYTTTAVLAQLLDTQARQVVQRLTAAMVRDDLIRAEAATLPNGRRVMLYGITTRGQLHAADLDAGEEICERVFESGRVALSVLQHTLDIQSLQISAERAGWRDWQLGDRMAHWEAGQGRPDVVATHPSGERWALECERSIKTRKRYAAILADRLQAIRRGDYARVVWLSPTADEAKRLGALVRSIPSVVVAGQVRPIEPERHHTKLDFRDYAALPAL